jgi:hypothetical protein
MVEGHTQTEHGMRVTCSLQEKGIRSSAFLCSSGPMFITENMFLNLKTDVHNLCTSVRPKNIRWVLMFLGQIKSLRNITTYVHRPDQEAEEHKMGSYVPRPRQIPNEYNDLCSLARSEN